jgi:hypothetical protein
VSTLARENSSFINFYDVYLSKENTSNYLNRYVEIGTLQKTDAELFSLGYGLDDRMNWLRFSAGSGNFSLRHHVQTASGTHPAFYPMRTRGSFHGGKVAEA